MKITKLRLLTLAGGIALGSTLMSFASSAQRSATPVQARPLPLARAERAHPGDDRRPVIAEMPATRCAHRQPCPV